jgi:hypothetical protein
MTTTDTVPDVRVTNQADGAVTLTAHQRYTITIGAEDRAPLAAAILPAPPREAIGTETGDTVLAIMYDSAFGGPAVLLSTDRRGLVADLTPDAAEQLAAQILAAAREARERAAEIEGDQDRACDTPAEPYARGAR